MNTVKSSSLQKKFQRAFSRRHCCLFVDFQNVSKFVFGLEAYMYVESCEIFKKKMKLLSTSVIKYYFM